MFPKRLLAPGFLTVMNLFLGFYSVISSSKEDYVTASWLIVLAAIFDAFDGKVARATKGFSKFGGEFDSLADVISFGAAPSFLLYQVHLHNMGPAGLIISFFPLMFGAIRLARFNIEVAGPDKIHFKGLPIPAAAGTLASFVIFNYHIWNELWIPSLILPLTISVSLFMVSTLEFDALPKFTFRSGKRNSILFMLLLTGATIVVFFPQKAAFPLATAYIIYSSIRSLLRMGIENNGSHEKRRKRLFNKKAVNKQNKVTVKE